MHTGNRLHPLHDLLEVAAPRRHVVPVGAAEDDVGGIGAAGREARVDVRQPVERPRQQARRRDERQRQRDLPADQERAQAALARARADARRRALLERGAQARAIAEAGRETEQRAGDDGHCERDPGRRRSDPTASLRGRVPGSRTMRSFVAARARPNPTIPPSTVRTRLSTICCCTSRRRPAPSAARRDVSRPRLVARTSSRFARLEHAITSTSTTEASATSRGTRALPATVLTERDHTRLPAGVRRRIALRESLRQTRHLLARLRQARARREPPDHSKSRSSRP